MAQSGLPSRCIRRFDVPAHTPHLATRLSPLRLLGIQTAAHSQVARALVLHLATQPSNPDGQDAVDHLGVCDAFQYVSEAARFADRYVVITFFHPVSLHNPERRVRERLSRRTRTRHAATLKRLATWFDEAGFDLLEHAAEPRDLRVSWIASLRRR